MAEVLFYRLSESPVEATLPGLIERSLERGWRVLVRVGTDAGLAFLDDQLHRHDDIVSEALTSEPGLPDPGLGRQYEACASHHVPKRRLIGQQARVEDDVGIRGERLIRGKPVRSAQVHRLSPDEDHGI